MSKFCIITRKFTEKGTYLKKDSGKELLIYLSFAHQANDFHRTNCMWVEYVPESISRSGREEEGQVSEVSIPSIPSLPAFMASIRGITAP